MGKQRILLVLLFIQLLKLSQQYDTSCFSIYNNNPSAVSGVYTVQINAGMAPNPVYCNMVAGDGGWTVIQRRKAGSENFNRPWADYAKGFGSLTGEFWLGNDLVSNMSASNSYSLRITLGDWSGVTKTAQYYTFSIASAYDMYRLGVAVYSGNAGDSLSYQNGMQFSTYDQDHDLSPANCAVDTHGGWWHNQCQKSNLNGKYNSTAWGEGVDWESWHGHGYSLKFTEMSIGHPYHDYYMDGHL